MNTAVRKINAWFRTATVSEFESLRSKIILSERQSRILEMFYLHGHDIDFIADSLNTCRSVVNEEIRHIRDKIEKVLLT